MPKQIFCLSYFKKGIFGAFIRNRARATGKSPINCTCDILHTFISV